MAIQFLQCHAAGATSYAYILPFATDISEKMQSIGFTELVAPYASGATGGVTMAYNGYEIVFTINGGSYQTNIVLKYNGTNIATIGNFHSAPNLLEGTLTLEYAKHEDDFILGFCPDNWSGYVFHVGFWTLADNYIDVCVLPTLLANQCDLKNGNVADGSWKNMFNVSTDEPNKGLFRQFIRTKSNGYLDMTNEPKTSVYNINTGFTFTLHSPVEVNGVPFIPLNNYTLFQYD